MEARIDQYNKSINTVNNGQYRDNAADKLSTKLQSVNIKEISYVSGLLFFRIDFEFWINLGYNEGLEFDVSEYFHANLSTAEITKLEFEWTESEKEKIISKIKDELNSDYLFIKYFKNYQSLDDMTEHKKKRSTTKDISSDVKLEEADFYWLDWGLMISFPQFTASSELYSGNSFEVFIPLEKAKIILKNIPEFSFLKKLKTPENNQQDFNCMQFIADAIDIHDPRDIIDYIHDNSGEDKPKSVRVDHIQVMNDSTNRHSGSGKHEFDKDGKLLKSLVFGLNDEITHRTEYLYNEKGHLLLKAKFSTNGSTGDTEEYTYDEKGNVIQILSSSGESFAVTRYFYNENEIFQMVRYLFKSSHNNRLSKNYYDGKELKVGDQSYPLNEKGKITSIKSDRHVMNQVQLSRNDNGQLVEVHRENDRYHRYFQYDSLNRLDKILNFENARPQITIDYSYDGIFPFPKKKESYDPYGGHNIHLIEEYTWELYE